MPFRCFAYGSNMFTPKMRAAAPSADFRAIGRLSGYVLRFNKHSTDDGSGKGNVVATGNVENEIWGVIFEIEDGDRRALDKSEGGYAGVDVEVLTTDGPVSAITYIAKADRVDERLGPYIWYKEFVVRGARQHGLPEAYVQTIEAFEAINDTDEERERKNLALLARGC